MPKKGSDKLVSATAVVRRNQAKDPQKQGGILTLHVPQEELKRIMEKEDLFKNLPPNGLMGIELTFFFSENAPMLRFPVDGEEMVLTGFEIQLYALGKLLKTRRKELKLLTSEEQEAERVAAQPAPPKV